MSRPETRGFQKPINDGKTHEVRMAVLSRGENYIRCSCGRIFKQAREKVRETAAQRHLDRRHGGQGLWM